MRTLGVCALLLTFGCSGSSAGPPGSGGAQGGSGGGFNGVSGGNGGEVSQGGSGMTGTGEATSITSTGNISGGPTSSGSGGTSTAGLATISTNASGGRSSSGGPSSATGGAAPSSGGKNSASGGIGTGGRVGSGGKNSASGGIGTGGKAGNGGSSASGGGGASSCVANLACKLNPPPSTGDIHQDCVDRINQFLTQCACLPPLTRRTDGEACADKMAEYDGTKNSFHAGLDAKICQPGGSQNECPGYGSDAQVINLCLQQMWDEGPPPTQSCTGTCYEEHGHFINMTDKSVTKVACGFYTTSSGEVWSVQNFSR